MWQVSAIGMLRSFTAVCSDMASYILNLFYFSLFSCVFCGEFTSFVNVEKLYTLEDELITIADVMLRQEAMMHEGDDVHEIFKINSTLAKVKSIHRNISLEDLTPYIEHPLNVLHLTKRLVREWKNVVQILMDSKSCEKMMRVKIENIDDNIPTDDHLTTVAHAIIMLQKVYDLSIDDIMSGKINDVKAQNPLSLDDAFDLARAAYDREHFYFSVMWLNFVLSTLEDGTNTEQLDFNVTHVMSLLSSAYYKMGRPKEALDTIDRLLQKNPNNKLAQRNRKFMDERSKDKTSSDGPIKKPLTKPKKRRFTEEICSGGYMLPLADSRLRCLYFPLRDAKIFSRSKVEAEILSWNPFIVVFPGFLNNDTAAAIEHLAYEHMQDIAYAADRYRRIHGISSVYVQDYTSWKWVLNTTSRLENLKLSNVKPQRYSMLVRNFGMEGYETVKLGLGDRDRVGSFVIFLNKVANTGGELVFPFTNVKITPKKGTVVFWESKAQKEASFCPVLVGSEWVAELPLFDTVLKTMSYAKLLVKPKL